MGDAVIASGAGQSVPSGTLLDCFVASLLAMTADEPRLIGGSGRNLRSASTGVGMPDKPGHDEVLTKWLNPAEDRFISHAHG